MPYALKKILKVRKHRENKARNHVVRCRTQLEQANTLKTSKERELADFSHWRVNEEQRLLDRLSDQPASVQDLLCFRSQVNGLRSDQDAISLEVESASKQVVDAEETLNSARVAHTTAYLQEAKIKAHKKRWMEDYRTELEKAAENEMDACAGVTFNSRNEAP